MCRIQDFLPGKSQTHQGSGGLFPLTNGKCVKIPEFPGQMIHQRFADVFIGDFLCGNPSAINLVNINVKLGGVGLFNFFAAKRKLNGSNITGSYLCIFKLIASILNDFCKFLCLVSGIEAAIICKVRPVGGRELFKLLNKLI